MSGRRSEMRMHHRHGGGAVLVLPAQLDLLAASRLAEIVRAARGAPLAIDASGVEAARRLLCAGAARGDDRLALRRRASDDREAVTRLPS
ncbi:MAG: hypothetical protein JNK46_16260 [Methylobacteriaceae bacterium]|nr:hypothetical protein [Methylobacteriaceae bacterium]